MRKWFTIALLVQCASCVLAQKEFGFGIQMNTGIGYRVMTSKIPDLVSLRNETDAPRLNLSLGLTFNYHLNESTDIDAALSFARRSFSTYFNEDAIDFYLVPFEGSLPKILLFKHNFITLDLLYKKSFNNFFSKPIIGIGVKNAIITTSALKEYAGQGIYLRRFNFGPMSSLSWRKNFSAKNKYLEAGFSYFMDILPHGDYNPISKQGKIYLWGATCFMKYNFR